MIKFPFLEDNLTYFLWFCHCPERSWQDYLLRMYISGRGLLSVQIHLAIIWNCIRLHYVLRRWFYIPSCLP